MQNKTSTSTAQDVQGAHAPGTSTGSDQQFAPSTSAFLQTIDGTTDGTNTATNAPVTNQKSLGNDTQRVQSPDTAQRIEEENAQAPRGSVKVQDGGVGMEPIPTSSAGQVEVLCGPLLNYKHMSNTTTDAPHWHGSVLLVTKPGSVKPELQLNFLEAVQGRETSHTDGAAESKLERAQGTLQPQRLYEDQTKTFWRFKLALPLQAFEARWEYHIPNLQHASIDSKIASTKTFVVPSKDQSMRIMFHSCNGFSVGTDMEVWKGPSLWNDVIRQHEEKPFHIYNDGIRVSGPLRPWTDMNNPKKRRDYPFDEKLRAECDDYYFDNYVKWYSTEPFASANGVIPQVNIWDDHDIIDGFGSYTDHFMKCNVFRGIGGVAHKYYFLFQHHIPPPKSTFTSDAPQTARSNDLDGTAVDPKQLNESYVMTETEEDPSFITGHKPGPYIPELSRSIYAKLGKHVAFCGIDARTERTRHQINYPETYNLIFRRVDSELSKEPGVVKHLIVLLGVPIAYPRLIWLENILTSPIIGPIRFLNKRFGVAGHFFNTFDGGVDLLDDLDDHYTARQHKKERKDLMLRLQNLAQIHNIRVTILSGDVHLGAIGRFYSNPKLETPVEKDHRFMPNIISSAITNKPPPKTIANLLARRNKIHHMDANTDETLMPLFDKDPGGIQKAAHWNHVTLPSRNYATLTLASEFEAPGRTNGNVPNGTVDGAAESRPTTSTTYIGKDGHSPLHKGETNAGADHGAATGLDKSGLFGQYGLDVPLRMEIDSTDTTGKTQGFGFCIPPLELSAMGEKPPQL